ncbi:AzlC family ABC transporter permease [Halobaculum sp. D14]|uniref:AzlC family ABC transporter permease n=1 Tax=unclassified Halobaculum TaxID=2640896 RepID=UPI003EC03878
MDPLPPDVRDGVRDTLPLLLGIVPFALVAGVAGIDAGLTPLQTVGMSVVVFAGASQLAAMNLLGENAALWVVVLTAVVINLRMLMYSASIAPHFRGLSARLRAGCAYLLTDQAYALSLARYTDDDVDGRRPLYYLAVGGTLWVVWQLGTVVGVVFGAGVPDSWRLGFAVPLVFLALLVPAVGDRNSLVAGAVAAAVAVVGAGLPFQAGLLVGAVAGVAAGLVAEWAWGAPGDRGGTDDAEVGE